MKNNNHFYAALAIVAVAMGVDFATGRDLAAFYTQMGRASWLGILSSSIVFGLLTAMVAHLSRRTGADGLFTLFRRMPGGPLGKGIACVYGLILVIASAMVLAEAGHIGALTLPMRYGRFWGGALAAALAGWIALRGSDSIRVAGALLVGCLALFELGLIFFGNLPAESGLNYELELKLRDNWGVALLFACMHACVCACISTGVTLRLSRGHMWPARLGVWSAMLFFVLLAGGNAVLFTRAEELLTLQLPFVALSSGWGKTGFYLSAALAYFAGVVTLSGLCYSMIPKRGTNKNAQRDVKL